MAEILGVVASLLGPAIELGKCIAKPIKRQCNYLCCFHSNTQELIDEAKKLEDARDGLQMQVNAAKNNAEVILPEVETWLEKANEFQNKITGIESTITNIQSGPLAIKSRFSLSKKAKVTAEAMKELRDCCNFNLISRPAEPAAAVSIPLGSTFEFESRKHIEENIMITLGDNKVNMIGICGMGGVGKTTMAKKVMNRAREEHLFDETLMVVVSQPVDKLRIQKEMADLLGLKLEETGSLASRAHKLRTRLLGGKRIFIVLDDVWESLKLEELGIPCESGLKGCTVLLTSRNSDVFKEMSVQKVHALEVLSETEAWYLFKSNVGTCIDDHNVLSVVQRVAKECKGLPIALVTVGVALKDEKNISIWRDVLQQLKNSNPIDMPKVLEDVYKPLKVSYELLRSDHAKSLFLLCCLFGEDRDIFLKDLIVYAMGLRMFEDIRNLGQARDRTCSLVEMLKNRFLLLEGSNEYCVKMHDVVRDVSIYIASEERRINCNDCTWISSFLGERTELSTGSIFPNLRLLLIDESAHEKLQITDNFFEGMKELNVLSVKCHSLTSLPYTTRLLKNLRTLRLYSCGSLETISVVGELENLEILICRDCYSIMELPLEIARLNRLRWLEISNGHLSKIEPGVISNLVELETLKIVGSFCDWEAENKEKERKNARLIELQSLTNLTCLAIRVEDHTLVAEQICLSPEIVNFDITIGFDVTDLDIDHSDIGFEKRMKLYIPKGITLGDWILKLFGSVENLRLTGEGLSSLELGKALPNVRRLAMSHCSTVKKLAYITTLSIDGRFGTSTVFPFLESLVLQDLENLEEICNIDGPISNEVSASNIAFKNLQELHLDELPALKHLWKSPYQNNVVSPFNNLSTMYISSCGSLRNLLSLTMANVCHLQLQWLQICSCEMMEQVFLWNEEENEKNDVGSESRDRITIFPKLKTLVLEDLPNLVNFCKGIKTIQFPELTQMNIMHCPQLKSFIGATSSIGHWNNLNNFEGINNDDDDDDDSLRFFCKPEKVAFGRLKTLVLCTNKKLIWSPPISVDLFAGLEYLMIDKCHNIRTLFSFSIAQSLVNLQHLSIGECREMVKVIEDDENKKASHGETTICLFPRLQVLFMSSLSKLEIFCNWRCTLELPSLKGVIIYNCPKMQGFSLESLNTPKLGAILGDYSEAPGNSNGPKDLNGEVQRLFLRVREEEEEEERWKEEEEERRKERRRKIKEGIRKMRQRRKKFDFSSTNS